VALRAIVTTVGAVALLTMASGGEDSAATHYGTAAWLNVAAPSDSVEDWYPSLGTDGNGTWIAAWDSLGGPFGNSRDIVFARSLDGGHTWTGPAPLNSDAGTDSGHDLLVRLEWDGAGTWLAIWVADGRTGADRDIFAARSIDGGMTWGLPGPVNTNAAVDSGFDSNPQVASDGAGNWVAVWDSSDTLGGTIGDDPDILVATSDDNGVTWSAPAALNSDAPSDTLRDLSAEIQTDGEGHWVAAWETLNDLGGGDFQDNDLVFARSDDNGATWTPRAPLHPSMLSDIGQDHLIQIETDGSGTWVAAWNSKRVEPLVNNRDILSVRSYDNGLTWTAPADVRTDAATDPLEEYAPQLVSDGRGNWVVVWDGQDDLNEPNGLDFDTYVALSTDGAVSWLPATYLSDGGDSDSGGDARAQIATDRRGNWVMAWDSDETLGGQVGPDREILYVNCLPFDLDGDGADRCEDADDDSDLVADLAEGSCGSDGMDAELRPERSDGTFSGTDDDGDGMTDEPLATDAVAFDCDGDGYAGEIEAHVFNDPVRDQDPCGVDAWPPDIASGGIPSSTNKVNLLDITSFIGPVRRINTSPGDSGYAVRWDLLPGAGLLPKVINVQDILSVATVTPAMMGGVRANNGPACPWAP
jgi:hypothetical protein